MAVTPNTLILQSQLDDLATLANTKLSAMGSPASFSFPSGGPWIDELERLRSAVDYAVRAAELVYLDTFLSREYRLDDPAFCVSGPWCFAGPVGGVDKGAWFSSGVGCNFKDVSFYHTAGDTIEMRTRQYCQAIGIPNTGSGPSSWHTEFRIGGGDDGILYMGRVTWAAIQNTGATANPVFTHSTNIPGITFGTIYPGTPDGTGTLYADIASAGESVSPGDFYFDVSVDGDHEIQLAQVANMSGFTDPVSHNIATAIAFDVVEASHGSEVDTAVRAAGPVRKIDVVEVSGGSLAAGIWFYDAGATAYVRKSSCNLMSSPGVLGYFTGLTQPITSMIVQNSAYLSGLDVPYGDEKMQRLAPDPSTAGISAVEPAIGFRAPRYPCFRDTDTLPSGGDWDTWNPESFQIYSITARRKAVATASGILIAPNATSDIEVKIGHKKSGTFVDGITFSIPTGQAYSDTQYVCWPIFDGTPLCYQCDEELFVSATSGVAVSGWRSTTAFPSPPALLAAHVNDLEAILNLL